MRILISILAFLVCCPIAILLISSLRYSGSFVEVMFDQPEFIGAFWNSVKIALGITAGQFIIGVPAAWGLARYEFLLRKTMFTLYIIMMLLPFQILMLSEYLVLDIFNFINTPWAVIIPGAFSAFPVFIMYNFFRRIPNSVIEAARLDGAEEIQLFVKIGLPLGSPGIIAALTLQFIEYWSVIEQPLVFYNDPALWPLSLYLPYLGNENLGIVFTASVIALIPSILIFSAGQRYLQGGIAATAVKE